MDPLTTTGIARVYRSVLLTALVVAACRGAGDTWAAGGELDPSFGIDGVVTTPIGPTEARIDALAMQIDGKIVGAGTYKTAMNDYDFALLRYNPDGTPDASFDGDGLVTTRISEGHDGAHAVGVQADGKIVAAGFATVGTNRVVAVARYDVDGSLDVSFGGDGIVTTAIGATDDGAMSLAIQADGRLVVAGWSSEGLSSTVALARYDGDGTLDGSFDADGIVVTPLGTDSGAAAVALQADGRIVVAGHARVGGSLRIAVARYEAHGALDASFDGDGSVATVPGHASALVVQPDGKLVAAGYGREAASGDDFKVVRYESDGSLDSSFGGDGIVTTPVATIDDWIFGLAIQRDGKIVAAGAQNGNAEGAFALARYHLDGSLDASFGNGGTMVTVIPEEATAYAVALQDTGELVVGGDVIVPGRNRSTAALARYLAGAVCGDGVVASGEECDDGNRDDDDACRSECVASQCGDGFVWTHVEQCDDGGTVDGDGCNADCTLSPEGAMGTVAASGSVTTDGEGDGATASDPIETTVTTPTAGTIAVNETGGPPAVPSGYALLGAWVEISAPMSGGAEDPLRVMFEIDASLMPSGATAATLQIFRNGILVLECSGAAGTAFPDPCVGRRTVQSDGDAELEVLTTSASTWGLGVERCGDGVLTPGEACDDGNTRTHDCCSATCDVEPVGTLCRSPIGTCDAPERCDGTTASCPVDAFRSDQDGDGLCDVADPCATPTSVTKPKLTIAKVGGTPGDDRLTFKGSMTFAPGTSLDPSTTGVRIVIAGATGTPVLDATIPGGLFDAATRAGWTVSSRGTSWSYQNPAGPHGIAKVALRSVPRTPGLVAFAVKAKASTYRVVPSELPLIGVMVLAPPATLGPCAQASFAGPYPAATCAFNGTGHMLVCREERPRRSP